MALSVNITMSLPPEMVEKIDSARGSWSRSRYIRYCVRAVDGTPFENPEEDLPDVSDLDVTAEAGGSPA